METMPIISGAPIFEISQKRYDKLVAAEAKLNLLISAINKMNGYVDIEQLKTMFDIKGE